MSSTNFEPLSPLMFLERSVKYLGKSISVIDNDTIMTYEELYDEWKTLSKVFHILEIRPGDRIAYLMRNNHKMLISFYSVPMCGAILVPINIRLCEQEINYILQDSKANILVVDTEFFKNSFLSAVKKIIVVGEEIEQNIKVFSYQKLIQQAKDQKEFCLYKIKNENSTITINYTSGTTQLPKGVEYSHRSAYLNSLGQCIQTGLNFETKYLWTLPMFHCNGWCYIWAVTAVGGTHVCLDRVIPEDIINIISNYEITHMSAAPTVLSMLANAKNFLSLKLKNILKIITAGSSPSSKIIKKFLLKNIDIIHVYGLTETLGPFTICEENHLSKNFGIEEKAEFKTLQGIPSVHSVFLKVVDKNFLEVEKDGITIGEVVMRGNNLMKGYYNDAKNTKKVFRKGWFFSGDLAVVNPNGYIEIKDRIKNIIVSGGENIPTIEIENVIQELNEVYRVAVIPSFNEKWGEVVHAVIELHQNKTLTKEYVTNYCKSKLAQFKCPKIITFAKIPINNTGKIQKNILKKNFYFVDEL